MEQSESLNFREGQLVQNGLFPEQELPNSDQEQINYQDAFEEARRQQVLRNINQGQSYDKEQFEEHEQVMQILDKRGKRLQKIEQKKMKDEMKKLRHQNALQFFGKVKLSLLLAFRESIQSIKSGVNYKQNKLHRFISCLNIQQIKFFQKLRNKEGLSISRKQFIQFIVNIFTHNKDLNQQSRYVIILSLAFILGIGFRKISFFDITDMDLQSFYNLKYQPVKGKKKKLSEEIDKLRNKLQRKAAEQELKNQNFINIQDYSFNPNQINSNISQTQSKNTLNSIKSKNEQIRQIKSSFHHSYCQIYCPFQSDWSIFNMEALITQQIGQVKNMILDGRAIIGFFSVRLLKFQNKFQTLCHDRLLKNFQIRDHTIEFCDNYQNILKRRHRLGCKSLYKNMIKQSNFYKTMRVLSDFDKILIDFQRKKQFKWAHENFPKSVKQMRMSDYFVTPSLVEKYQILRQGAKPLPNIEFHEEKVYYKSDLQRVSSKMGWIDEGRMVRQGEIPIKTTENKNKTTTKLYKFNQTEPYQFRIVNGDFVLDQDYNSIYVPPSFELPKGYVIIEANVQYLCKRSKYRCARIVQGFSMAGGHLIPNNIGYIIEQEHREQIQKIYKQRQQKLRLKKESRKVQNAMSLWRKLFKSIIITQQIHQN